MGSAEIAAFLTSLALDQRVAASTQNQALSALLLLYQNVLHQEVGSVDAVCARKPKRLPIVLTKNETRRVINAMSGVPQLLAKLLYGSGLRALEGVRLRVKDIDFAQRVLLVRQGKGDCRSISHGCTRCIPEGSQTATGLFMCYMRWSANIPRPTASGAGNRCSPPKTVLWTLVPG